MAIRAPRPARTRASTSAALSRGRSAGRKPSSRARAALARELVFLPADLPRLKAADVDALVLAGRGARIAIAPDRRGTGTNGLYLPAALDFPCRFGVESRARHE